MGKLPYLDLYTGDYLQDTRNVSLAGRGAWSDLLCYMHRSPTRGAITEDAVGYSRILSATVEQSGRAIMELIEKGVCDAQIGGTRVSGKHHPVEEKILKLLHVTLCNNNVTANVTLINRRMERERKTKEDNKIRVERHRQKRRCNGGGNENVTSDLSLSVSSSPPSVNTDVLTSSPRLRQAQPPGEDAILLYRKRLRKTEIQQRFWHNVIVPLEEDLSTVAWLEFIKPLLVKSVTETEIVLWVERESTAMWIRDNYIDAIRGKLKNPGMEVKVTSEMD